MKIVIKELSKVISKRLVHIIMSMDNDQAF